MKSETLLLTQRCNQACSFCARVAPDATDPAFEALRRRIVAFAAAGVRALTLTGGEPLLRGDVAALVGVAAASGITAVALETNATLLATTAQAEALRAAGVTQVRISVVATDPGVHLAVVGQRTTPRHVFRGIKACLDAGLEVVLRLPMAPDLAPPAQRLSGLVRAFPAVTRYVAAPVGAGERTLRPDAALAPDALAAQLSEAYREARRLRVALELSPEHVLAPCLHPVEPGALRLFERVLDRDERVAPNAASAACGACALARHCRLTAAQLLQAAPDATPRAVPDATPYLRPGKNPGSRLHVLREPEVAGFFHVDYEYPVAVEHPTSRLGIIYRCNQVCTFCELADMDVDLAPARVRAAIDASRARGSTRLIVTGGEPTLSPDLVAHVAYARDQGFTAIELQTNAVLLAKPGAVERLRDAGLTSAQVSLHGPDSARSDRLTAAPGTHQLTLRGVDNLLAAGLRVVLNYLVFKDVCDLVVDFVALAEARWAPHRERVTIQFHSPRNEFPSRDEALRHIARYADYAHLLRAAIDRARAFGFGVHDLQDPTGIPALCVLGADPTYLGPILAQAERPRVHRWERDWMGRVDACARCDLAHACIGVPRHYLALYGDAEFAPIRRDAAGALAQDRA